MQSNGYLTLVAYLGLLYMYMYMYLIFVTFATLYNN